MPVAELSGMPIGSIEKSRMPTCVAIGEGNLILTCIKYILEAEFAVCAVFTNTDVVAGFCEENNIPFWRRGANIEDAIGGQSIDYLFSIVNPRILSDNVLKIPNKLSINYHDSPLPAYAGVHATSWALINGETLHGISWHVVEAGIDTGDILQFREVDILPDDSAFSLNMKCQSAAKEAFNCLILQIRDGNLQRRRQQQIGRSYFGLHAIPPNLAVLNFKEKCRNLYNLGRALEFGNNVNALGSSHILTSSGHFLLITNIEMCPKQYNRDTKCGTILDIVDDTLVVNTDGSPLLLTIVDLDGSPIPPSTYKTYDISVGERLSSTFNIDTSLITPVRKKEFFWRNKMAVYEPTVFFRQRMNVVATITDISNEVNLKSAVIKLPDIGDISNALQVNDTLLSAFVAFLSRITCEPTVCLGLLPDKSDIPLQARDLYSDICPGVFHVELQNEIQKVIREVNVNMNKYKDAKTFLVDMFYRYPELRGQKRTPHHNLALGMVHEYDKEISLAKSVLQDCNILILFNNNGKEMHLLYNEKPAKEREYRHIVDVLKHFPTFLSAIDPNNLMQPLHEMNLVPPEELRILYPSKQVPVMKDDNVYRRFLQQCSKTPNGVALKSTSEHYTYEQTSSLVKDIAELLHNVEKEERIVGIYLPNSIAYVISLFAVLRNNNAYLPLPLDYPPERLLFTLSDAKVKTILTTREVIERSNPFKEMPSKPTVSAPIKIGNEDIVLIKFVSDENGNVKEGPSANYVSCIENGDILQQDVCYVMYTSGSTGRPKGVKVTHKGVINLAEAQIKAWSLCSSDVIAQFASIGFDATTSEIFTALLSGATLAVLGEKERLGNEFVHAMDALEANVITLAPSALNIYGPNELRKLKKVVTAGEACPLRTAVKWTLHRNGVRFFNAYGPTETTVCATIYEYIASEDHAELNEDLPIGKAIDGSVVYLFDDFMNPVPPDVVGEIYVGGIGVSKGYLGHAAHYNTQKFVQNPLTDKHMLLYKTGDHAFQDANGELTYIGRLDDMVKVRGQRVDLSEIEQVIIQHPKIEIAVVVVHKCTTSREINIAAYVAPSFIYLSEFREYLSKVFPKYMIPTFIKKMEIADFPMTLNGKIDRKALEKDESVHEHKQLVGNSHLNSVQLTIAKLWCSILNLGDNAVYNFHRQTSFIELGGNSLQLVLLQRLLEEKLHVQFSFTDMGTADTIEDFSELVKRKKDMLRTTAPSVSQDVTTLRKMILKDSCLDLDMLPSTARRGSVQFNHFSSFTQKCTFKYPRNVLISGVTGFLGAHLLSELLEQTNAHVCCMVRESTEARGLGRIIDNLRRYNIWKSEYASRIAVVISDLSQERLGIAPDIYNGLCNSIDAVMMNAAKMNFNTGYEDHRVANVDGTKEFIKFALTGTQKFLFTTSSLGVFLFPSSPDDSVRSPRKMFYENESLKDPCQIDGGYGQSKWASERLVMQALDYLPGGAIFRPARISGSSKDGRGPKNDLYGSTVHGMTALGTFPDMDFPYDLTPVDYVAKAMIEISVRICNETAEHEKVYHLFNHHTFQFNQLFDGMNLKSMPLNDWRQVLKTTSEEHKDLVSLTPFFMSSFWDRSPNWPIFDTRNTNKYISAETKRLLLHSQELNTLYKTYFDLK